MCTKVLSVLGCCVHTTESIFAIEAAVKSNQRQPAEDEAEEKSCTCIQNELYQARKGKGF